MNNEEKKEGKKDIWWEIFISNRKMKFLLLDFNICMRADLHSQTWNSVSCQGTKKEWQKYNMKMFNIKVHALNEIDKVYLKTTTPFLLKQVW